MAFINLTLIIRYIQKNYNSFVANKIKDMERIYNSALYQNVQLTW